MSDEWIDKDKVRYRIGAPIVMGGWEDRELEALLPVGPIDDGFAPRPKGSPLWWPLAIPVDAALCQDELKCLLAVARRLRHSSRMEIGLSS